MPKTIDPVSIADAAFAAAMTERFGPLDELVKRGMAPEGVASRQFMERAGAIVNGYLGIITVQPGQESVDLYEYYQQVDDPSWINYVIESRDAR